MNTYFKKISEQFLPTMNITMQTFEHIKTGAMHYHFASDHSENVFMVALRTMPHNSTGVAHILEHTVLCGSKNFDVRDPFFSMLRRSMQTFMNAFTSSDWTAYPFATENRQDFDNLLRVYLDAVFFPNLKKEDFMQEGHRFDFDENNNLVIKGVVFNEMKGVYGNIFSRLYEMNKSIVYPETTYHFDSGGLPQTIWNLTYDEFLAFHKKHYHPTNATFLTFGNIPAEEHHIRFEELALKYFDGRGEKVTTTNERRLLTPVTQIIGYPNTDTNNSNQVHIIASWLLGAAHNAREVLEAHILYEYLLGHSGSPLYFALENLECAAMISPLSMLDDSGREASISTGIVTDNPKNVDIVKKTIFETFENVLQTGFNTEIVEGIIDTLDMQLRKQTISEPYGLALFLQVIGAATHDENMVDMADPSEILNQIRENVKNPEYLKKILKESLVENAHFTIMIAVPDENAAKEEQNIEARYCQKKLAKMSNEEKNEIKKNAKNLLERQSTIGDVSILPKLHLADISRVNKVVQWRNEVAPNYIHYNAQTNGVRYIQKMFPVENINKNTLFYAAITADFIGQLWYKNLNYAQAQNEIAKSWTLSTKMMFIDPYKEQYVQPYFQITRKFLDKNTKNALVNMQEVIEFTKFTEIEQIRTIIAEKILLLKESLLSSGHKTALSRAVSTFSLPSYISEQLWGIALLQSLKDFNTKSDEEIISILEKTYKDLITQEPITLTVAIESYFQNSKNTVVAIPKWEENQNQKKLNEAWISDLWVGYCALAIPTVASDHPDALLLSLLWKFLWDGYLHSAIREKGGAYGSGANYDAQSKSFRFFSYRDPRIEGTFADFEASIDWFLKTDHEDERLDEAKIGIIASIDTPKMPAIEAFADSIRHLKNYTEEDANRDRQIILDATMDDLKEVAKKYISDFSKASRVVITGKQNLEILKKMEFEIFELE